MKLFKFWNNQWNNQQPLLTKHNCWTEKNVQNLELGGEKRHQSTMFLYL